MPHLLTLASDCIKKKDIPNGGAEPLLRDTQKFGRLLQAMVDDLLHRKPDSGIRKVGHTMPNIVHMISSKTLGTS